MPAAVESLSDADRALFDRLKAWRLAEAGVDVSEVRNGRKPGTRVMTVRSGTSGVPTLLVQPSTGNDA